MSKKPRNPAKKKRIPKTVQIAKAVSKRFLDSKQELAIQTTAGVIREAVAGKGGHNKPRVPYKKNDDVRDKKVPYDKKRWGTLGLSEVSTAIQKYCINTIMSKSERKTWARQYNDSFKSFTVGKSTDQLPHQVGKQLQKANAYKAKLKSKKWKAGTWYDRKIS